MELSFAHDFDDHFGFETVVHLVSSSHGGYAFPCDVLARYTWPSNHTLHPYVAVGLTVIAHVEDHTTWKIGFASAVGTDIWLGAHMGLFVEGNFNLIAHLGTEPELGFVSGVVTRF